MPFFLWRFEEKKKFKFFERKRNEIFCYCKRLCKISWFEEALTIDANGKADNADLTSDLDDSLLNKFDCVIDSGVLFWCFDPQKSDIEYP